MLNKNYFIPEELAKAPTYIKGYPPNLVLRKVPLDCNSSFQVWSPKANGILLPEEASLLKTDYLRIATICTRLIWLLGANCSEDEDYLMGNEKVFYDWDATIYFVSKYQFRANVIDVIFSPQNIRPLYNSVSDTPTHWVMEPPCWELFFLKLEPTQQGFKAEPRTQPLSVLIWTGKPQIKAISTSKISRLTQ